ncbi:tumor necrosis factor ligand superfamily member 14 [Lates calcarifer]|uniref:Tumor necrosis factor ligand superfamily member 14 n=1 Tax=Lates calcarifer TaxID=8187 RepID=A0AAJ8BBF3_LATCA|nr:tumor necrosis factor ligand superfamily member 14 [Lates calcarifer]
MAIKAIVYLLYQPGSVPSTPSPELVGGENLPSPSTQPSFHMPGSKPAALLTDGPDVAHGPQIMAWSTDHIPLLHEMDYKNGNLLIQRDGVYYVYSKVHFLDSGKFYHSLVWFSTAYPRSVTLLTSRKSSPRSNKTTSSTFLGGVFAFHKDDALHGKVSNTTKIKRLGPFENVFGAYMI